MKKAFLVLSVSLFVGFVSITSSFATVYVVNNYGPGDFDDVSTAIDGAAAGDTLYIIGSPINYGSITLTKRLTLIGPGYFLDQNPNSYANKLRAQIQYIYIDSDDMTNPERDLNTGAAGSTLIGLDNYSYPIYVRANNVTIDRCRSYYIIGEGNTVSTPSNLLLSRSFISSYVSNISGSTIKNSIIQGSSGLDNVTNTLVTHCDIYYVYTAETSGCIFTNCKFYSTYILQFQDPNNVRHCIFTNGDPSGDPDYNVGTNNIFSVTDAAYYISPAPEAEDAQFQLSATSPGIGAGEGGVDVGPFGGTTPYILSGLPPIPVVYEITAPTSVNAPDGLPVTIKVRAQN